MSHDLRRLIANPLHLRYISTRGGRRSIPPAQRPDDIGCHFPRNATMLRRLVTATFALLLMLVLGLSAPARQAAQDKPKSAPDEPKGEAKTVSLKVLLPQANAKLTIEGQLSRQAGDTRTFRSPPLKPGVKYVYTLSAE